MKKAIFAIVLILGEAIALTPKQIGEVREFIATKSPASELIPHLEATLQTMRIFAKQQQLKDPLSEKDFAKKYGHPVCLMYAQTMEFANCHDLQPSFTISPDPNNPTAGQIRTMLNSTRELLEELEDKLIDLKIDVLTAPLMIELAKELKVLLQ